MTARDYAAALVPGDHIDEATDGAVIEPFRAQLPAALAERGLRLEALPATDQHVVRRADVPHLHVFADAEAAPWEFCDWCGCWADDKAVVCDRCNKLFCKSCKGGK